jgi:hypothetical protein
MGGPTSATKLLYIGPLFYPVTSHALTFFFFMTKRPLVPRTEAIMKFDRWSSLHHPHATQSNTSPIHFISENTPQISLFSFLLSQSHKELQSSQFNYLTYLLI